MAISQLFRLQERVEEIAEGCSGEHEAEDGFEGHGLSLSLFDSDLVAALDVPERQREEEEEGVEHADSFQNEATAPRTARNSSRFVSGPSGPPKASADERSY